MPADPAAAVCDVSGVQPEAREVIRAAAQVYARHSAPWLVGLLVHGSAYKGDFIPGCSDIDLKLYLRDEVFAGAERQLPFALAAAIQRDLARIDPAPFQYIQCYAEGSSPRAGQLGPVPGAYHLLLGRLPVAEATAEQLEVAAHAALARLNPHPAYITTTLLQHGGGKLERAVRLACTDVWPALYQALSVQRADPLRVWTLPKQRAIALLLSDSPMRRAIERFYASIIAYYDDEPSVERGIDALRDAMTFLAAARAWWDEVGAPDGATPERL
ncbi:MAG TPA: hypothetical protein VF812_10745 [Ktedonobacterales bacterium]